MFALLLLACPATPPEATASASSETESVPAGETDTRDETVSATETETETETETMAATGDTAAPCASGTVGVEELTSTTADGAPGTADGLSGHLVAGPDASGSTSAWVLGRSATLPSGESDGVVSFYEGLGSVTGRIYAHPDEGELDALVASDLDGDGGLDAAVSIEHAGLIGARVGVHFSVAGKVEAQLGEVLFTSEARGASPPLASSDLDGDGLAELLMGWADQVEVWSGPLTAGSYAEGDGTQQLAGKTRLWMQTGDLDGDGYAELVLPRKTEGDLAVLLGGVTGFTADLATADHVLEAEGQPGADDGGIRLADLEGDGTPDILATVTAATASDPVLLAWSSPTDTAPRTIVTGETGRYAAATLDADGDGAREILLSRFPYTGASGGLLLYTELDAPPLFIEPGEGTLLGAATGDGVDVDGDGDEDLLTVDPWGAGEWDPRLYVLSICD